MRRLLLLLVAFAFSHSHAQSVVNKTRDILKTQKVPPRIFSIPLTDGKKGLLIGLINDTIKEPDLKYLTDSLAIHIRNEAIADSLDSYLYINFSYNNINNLQGKPITYLYKMNDKVFRRKRR